MQQTSVARRHMEMGAARYKLPPFKRGRHHLRVSPRNREMGGEAEGTPFAQRAA
jgi:hypothetical protein